MSDELMPGHFLQVKVIMGLGWLERFGKHYFDKLSPPDFYTRVNIKDHMIYLDILVRSLSHFLYKSIPIPERVVHGTTLEIICTHFS